MLRSQFRLGSMLLSISQFSLYFEKCTYVIEGLKDSTYQAQQICNSGHMLRAASKQV